MNTWQKAVAKWRRFWAGKSGVIMIVATDENDGIGYNNDLPWPRNKTDMRWFRTCTTGHVVIMGRKTWDSMGGKALPNRFNVVITQDYYENIRREYKGTDEIAVCRDINTALDRCAVEFPDKLVFIIGGSQLYKTVLEQDLAGQCWSTQIQGKYPADVLFPDLEYYGQWHLNEVIDIASKEEPELMVEKWLNEQEKW